MRKSKAIGIAVVILIGIILLLFLIKFGQIRALIQSGKTFVPPPEAIGVFTAETQAWPNVFSAVGTVEADEGITISAEVSGKVQKILFKSGERVKAGTVILIQESDNETATLSAATARLRLAQANYERMLQLRKKNTVSQNELDLALQQKESAQGEVDNLHATSEKKMVKAPFDGRLGIRKVDLGQDLQVGSAIVTLQATNRVRINFPVPQHWLVQMTKGLPVSVQVGDGSGSLIKGEITAIGAEIDPVTRNATVQSSLENSAGQLIPGMAVKTEVTLSKPQQVLAVPSTAVIFATYGDTLFVVEKAQPKDGEKAPGSEATQGSEKAAETLKARQQFVRLGKSRGDYIEIVDGLKSGEVVASAGAFKLFNGQAVVISKTPVPEFKTESNPVDN